MELFLKKFKIKISEKPNRISFDLLNSGIFAEINFVNNGEILINKGEFKAKILNSNVKFDFSYDE